MTNQIMSILSDCACLCILMLVNLAIKCFQSSLLLISADIMLGLPLLLQGSEWVELLGCLSQVDLLLGFE